MIEDYVIPAGRGKARLDELLSGVDCVIGIDYGFRVNLETLELTWSAPRIKLKLVPKKPDVALNVESLMEINDNEKRALIFSFLAFAFSKRGQHVLNVPEGEQKVILALGRVEGTDIVLFVEVAMANGRRSVSFRARRARNLKEEKVKMAYFR